MSNPDALSHFQGSLGLRNGWPSPSPVPSSDQNSWFDHVQSTQCRRAPSWHFPLILSLLLQYPCGFWAYCANIHDIALLHYSHWPTISSMSMPPKIISLGRGHTEVRRGTCFIRVEEWDNNHYCITCHMDTQELSFYSSWTWSSDRP